jgi:restriction endonuclease Mrr
VNWLASVVQEEFHVKKKEKKKFTRVLENTISLFSCSQKYQMSELTVDHVNSSFKIVKTQKYIGLDLSVFTKTGVYDIPRRGSTYVTVCDFNTVDVKKEMMDNLQLLHSPMFRDTQLAIEMFVSGKTRLSEINLIDAICVQDLDEYVHVFINSNKATATDTNFSIALDLSQLNEQRRPTSPREPKSKSADHYIAFIIVMVMILGWSLHRL